MNLHGEIVRTGHFRSAMRHRCPVGCGWHHDEPTDPGNTPLVLPANYTSQDISDAITLEAQHRELLKRERVEKLIADHVATVHP